MSIVVLFEVKADYVHLRCRDTFKLNAMLEVYEQRILIYNHGVGIPFISDSQEKTKSGQ